jgi:type III secretory pathway component EscT
MAYADLTIEQKASVQALSQLVRPLAGELGRLLEKFQAVVSYYSGNVETILGELQSADLIPNETGLAGAQNMTKDQFVNLVGYMITAAATADGSPMNSNYHRALYAQACGPANLIVS